ncbi:MAG: ABC transporter permease, partial [Candidatus Zixiibacteriota bacterium]
MIRHTFKLIWNRKRRSMLLLGEILLSFVVLFAVAAAIITSVSRYVRPLGFSHENMWVLHIDKPGEWGDGEEDKANVRRVLEQVRSELVTGEDVRQASFVSGNYPYSRSRWTTSFHWDSKTYSASIWLADDQYAEVAGLNVLEGRWFNAEDDAGSRQAIVITRQMRDEVFGKESPLGKIETDPDPGKERERVVVGVVENYRYRGEFEPDKGGFFQRNIVLDTAADIPHELAFTVREGSDARVEERILKRLAQIAPGWNLRIETLVDARREYIRENLLGTGVFVAVAGFLILNVALGLFGVLWQSISRRHGEIGLRRAV